MSEEENIRLVREIGEVKAELSGLKAEVAGTNQRLDDIVITQLKDHGKRLAMQDIRCLLYTSHPLVREYDFPAELGNPVQQLVGSGRRSALEHTEKRRGRGSHRLAQIGDPARLFRLFVQPFYGCLLYTSRCV